jgi:hypothetical protein
VPADPADFPSHFPSSERKNQAKEIYYMFKGFIYDGKIKITHYMVMGILKKFKTFS